jgi:3-hydroxyisobutyrate dehydrogenase
MIVKRLEDACNTNLRASGFPEELVDNEPRKKGYEVIVNHE